MMQAARRTRFSYVRWRMRKVTQEFSANYSSDLARSTDRVKDASLKLTCDQASLLFLSGRERNTWYNYLTIRLLLVHNLDFSLIGQETEGYFELSHDWLPVWQCDLQSKKIPRADECHHGVWRGERRERVFVSFTCFTRVKRMIQYRTTG